MQTPCLLHAWRLAREREREQPLSVPPRTEPPPDYETQVPEDPAELHQIMFKKNLTSSKDTSAYKKPKRKVDDGSAKRERRRLKRQAKRQRTARYACMITNTRAE